MNSIVSFQVRVGVSVTCLLAEEQILVPESEREIGVLHVPRTLGMPMNDPITRETTGPATSVTRSHSPC